MLTDVNYTAMFYPDSIDALHFLRALFALCLNIYGDILVGPHKLEGSVFYVVLSMKNWV